MMKYAPVFLILTPPAKMASSEEGIVSGVASEKLQKGQSLDIKQEAEESNEEVSTISIIPHKTPQGPANADAALQSDGRHISSVKPETVSETSYSSVLALIPCEEGRTPPMTLEKASRKPDGGVHILQSVQEGSSPSAVREKGPDDGYNWRKYGQKNVKGNEYIRSYYKCTHPNCQVKRQVERSNDGQITDTIYFGGHDHPKPQANHPRSVGCVVSIVENRSAAPSATIASDKCNMHRKTPNQVTHPAVAESDDVKSELLQSADRRRDEADSNDAPDSKRQKKDNINANPVGKSGGEQRLVVKTMSEVDAVSDGYRWRKYGQKLVKGNPNPRSYYRCSNPGCPVKKHVERASYDPKMVVATYKGQHDHDMPPCRTVTYTIVGQNNQTSAQDGELGTKSRENEAICVDMVVHTSSDPHSTPGRIVPHDTVEENNQTIAQAGGSGTKSREYNAVCLDGVVHRSLDARGTLPGKNLTHNTVGENTKTTAHDGESGSKRKVNDTICPEIAVHTGSDAVNKLDEQLNGESGTKSEVCDVVSSSIAVHSGLDVGSESSKVKNIISCEENGTVGLVAAGPESRSTGPQSSQLRTKSEDGNDVMDVHVSESSSRISKEQQTQKAEAITS